MMSLSMKVGIHILVDTNDKRNGRLYSLPFFIETA